MYSRVCLRAAFSLLELATALVVIAILVAIAMPVISRLRARAQRVQCMANLKSLYIAAEQYVQDNSEWPQIVLGTDDDPDSSEYARDWIAALAPYKVEKKSWICPTIQNLMGNPDYVTTGKERIDYVASVFDDKAETPHRWPGQPWFAEVGDVHGNGNLIIFTDGSIRDLKTVAARAKR